MSSAMPIYDMKSLKLLLVYCILFSSSDRNNTEKPAYLCCLVMIFTDHICNCTVMEIQNASLPKLDSKIESSCSDF